MDNNQELLEKISEAKASINAAQERLASAVESLLPEAINRLNETLSTELSAIRQMLKQAVQYSKPVEPGYIFPFNLYVDFDWTRIDAEVITSDQHGATIVAWGGHYWKRRAKKDKYGRAIWFNRTYSPLTDTEWTYVRLVTFRDQSAPEPIEFAVPRRKTNLVPTAVSKPDRKQNFNITVHPNEPRDKAVAAKTAVEFDTAVSMIYDDLNGSVDSATTLRNGVVYTQNYDPGLNAAYLVGMDAYTDEFKYQLGRGKSKLDAHQAAKTKGHRAFKRSAGQL